MSKIKAVDELIEWGYCTESAPCSECGKQVQAIAAEIEAEIEERFMKLPVDADGVPIHVGDRLVRGADDGIIYTVAMLEFDGRNWWYESGDDCFACDGSRHKPRTFKDVLIDFYNARIRTNDYDQEAINEVYSRYADEIRELMGGSE